MTRKIPDSIPVPGAVISDLIRLGDGDTALLYLYLTVTGGEKTSADIANDLSWSPERTRTTIDKLISNALMPSTGNSERREPPVTESAPPLRARAPKKEAAESRQFYSLVQEVEHIFGRVLSSDELTRLFGIYDSLGLPPEVILQLIGYCVAETAGRDGNDRPPSMRYIEKAAYTWEREGIFTLELAEQYIKQRVKLREEVALVKKALSIYDRDLTPTEKKHIDSWLALGYDAQSISIAYDRTVTKTGRLTWNYMNSIINSWHSKGLHNTQDILEKDTRSERGFMANPFGQKSGSSQPDESELRRINRILESMDGEK